MNSDQVLALLRAKHAEDVFVPQCKDGPTQSVRTFAQLDAWVMPRSWSHPHTTGYEIKVSRSDFLGDEKWRKYLPCCNYLYFVAPPGIILENELAPEVGHIEVSKTGSRLFTKKKAQYRKIDEPAALFRYVLMCRSVIKGEHGGGYDMRGYWKQWLTDRECDAVFGHNVSKKIKQTVEEKITKVARENSELKEKMTSYDSHRAIMKKLGIPDDCHDWTFERKIRELINGISERDRDAIERAAEILPVVVKRMKELSPA